MCVTAVGEVFMSILQIHLCLRYCPGLLISQYWYRYQYYRRYFWSIGMTRRYFSFVVSKWVLAILFQLIFGNNQYQYFCQQATPLRMLHDDDRGTTSWVSAQMHAVRPRCTIQGDVNYMLCR